MSEQDNESKPKLENKDYGFPFVDVSPIQSFIVSEKKEKSGNQDRNDIGPEKTERVISAVPKPVEPTIKFESEEKVVRKAKSQLPLLLSLVFLIIIILGSIAYFLYYLPVSDKTLETSTPLISEELVAEAPPSDANVDSDLQMGVIEDKGTVTEAKSETPPIVSTPEVVSAEIIEVDRRGEIPYYNVIVASSPNERIARAEAQKMIDKGKTAWLIFPFGNTNSYRISVGRYEDLESATKAMETVRVEINESSWILKY